MAQRAALSMAFVPSSSSIAPAAEATNRANAHRPKKRVDRRRRRRRRRLWAGPGLRTYVRTYVVFLHTYPSRPVHGVCRLWAGSGPVFFTYVRTAPRGQVLLARECQRGRVLSFARETGRARAETFARAQRPSDGGT